MTGKTVTATEFRDDCLVLLDEVRRTQEVVTILENGKPVACLVPASDNQDASSGKPVFGGLRGSVLRYDDPFGPA